MSKSPNIETLLKHGSSEWNQLRKKGKVPTDHTGATFAQLFSANTDLSGMGLVGTEWEGCDLSRVNFKDADLSNAYFHGGRLQDCDFRGANLEGATFERLKILRCDFTGASGLDDIDFDEVDMDRVNGLDHEDAPARPPPPVVGVTSFTKEQRNAQTLADETFQSAPKEGEPPPFRPDDSPGALLVRALRQLGASPLWVLDVPGLRLPLPERLSPGSNLESLLRDVVKCRLEGKKATVDLMAVERAQQALRLGTKEAAVAATYLRELGEKPRFRFASASVLRQMLKAELDIDDLTGQVDPRITAALLELKLTHEVSEALSEVRRRLAAAQLFTALLEAGFHPDNNWEEAVDASESSQGLASLATSSNRPQLAEAFSTFSALPEEVRARRLAYLAEAAFHLETLARYPADSEPNWLTAPEHRECDAQEMRFVAALKAQDIPVKAAHLAQQELGVAPGEVPQDSEEDLFIHFHCDVCGKEKLIVQTP